MKVAHLTTTDISLRYLVLPQLRQVIADGGEAIGISAAGPFVADLEQIGIRHVELASSTRSANPLADVRAAWELWKVLRQEHPDILHTHNPKPGLYGRVVGKIAGVPVVINTVHGLYATPTDGWLKRLIVYLLEGIAARFSNLELVQNPEDLELMTRLRIIPKGKGRLLGNGVDLDRFRPDRVSRESRTAERSVLGLKDENIVIGIVGRLVAEKGFPELIEAAEELDDRFVVLAVGPTDPEKSDALSRETLARAEAAGVRFLGMRKDVELLYPLMDIFVLPSHREGFPRAAMEAAASGLPVIATDIRGCRQVVENEVNGVLTPVKDPHELAIHIQRLGSNAELRAKMGKASRERAEEMFDESRVVEIVNDSYHELYRRRVSATSGSG